MPIIVYRSTDPGAPALNGTAGSLVNVLDAILVNGYGAKANAGWGIANTGTNKRVYRSNGGSTRYFYRVQDDGPGTGNTREARIYGSEGTTNIDTQTNKFPASQFIVRKSMTTDTANNQWIAVADNRTLYFFNRVRDFPGWTAFMFGEYYSLKPTTDANNAIIMGRTTEQTSVSTTYPSPAGEGLATLSAVNATVAGTAMPRTYNEFFGPVTPGKHGNPAHSAATLVGLSIYPNFSANIHLTPISITENAAYPVLRGRMRGLYHILHPASANLQSNVSWTGTSTWLGVGSMSGKTFMSISPTADGTGIYVIETSDTWETN